MKLELAEHAPIPEWKPDGPAPPVLYFPVRHYSPASALALRQVFDAYDPTVVLIEGPADFNDQLDQLALDHDLPIALYSWVRMDDGTKRAAFYPFCEFSPEWVALQAGLAREATVEFIDLPWVHMARAEAESHRYSDHRMRYNPYPDALAQKLGVHDFDGVWDELFEIRPLDPHQYVRRALDFCYHLRTFGDPFDPECQAREKFMAGRIRAHERDGARVLVVTGGFHSVALWAIGEGLELEYWRPSPEDAPQGDIDDDAPPTAVTDLFEQAKVVDSGIALTPFSYPRVDRLSGYQSGLSGPAFYEHVWRRRVAGEEVDSTELLESIVGQLRGMNQIASTADVIAVRSTAEALARMRGHDGVWRFDLLDALSASLVKEEIDRERHHPVFQVARMVLRGTRRGILSERSAMPPLVGSLREALQALGLQLADDPREVRLDLANSDDLRRSQLLHKLRAIGVAGFSMSRGVDFAERDDLSDLVEVWDLRWSPEHDATLIEAAVYGTDVVEAATSIVRERAAALDGRARAATALAVDVAQMGLPFDIAGLPERLEQRIAEDGDFFSVGGAVGDLLYLWAHDEVLGSAGSQDLGELFLDALRRGLWLFESLGTTKDRDAELLDVVRNLYRAFRAAKDIAPDEEVFVGPMRRAAESTTQSPIARGAAHGALYSLGKVELDEILEVLASFVDAVSIGDFLAGFFSLAREAAQRDPRLLQLVDQLITDMPEEEFLELAPALRFAFTFFTPREKHGLVDLLFGEGTTESGEQFVSADTARAANALDVRIRVAIRDFGLRGEAAQPDEEAPAPPPPADEEAGSDESQESGESGETPSKEVDDASAEGSHEQAADAQSQTGESAGAAGDRAARWRLVLGLGVEGRFPDLPTHWDDRDQMLGFLYDREYGSGRNVRGSGKGDPSDRKGGLGESVLSVPDWINGIHELFPRRTVERLERDALDRYALEEVVTRPEVLQRATPNPTLLKAVLRTKHLMDQNVLSIARRLVKQVIDELFDKLATEIQNPFTGSLDRRRRSYRKIAKNFDANETIRRNLRHWDSENGRLVIHEPIFNSRVRHHADKWRVITLVDQSGSMLESVIHAAITASVFHGLRAIESRLVAFDTSIVDLSNDAGDPVETLMKVQLGGGTDIANALEYAERMVTEPRKTIVILITDFFEGGPPAHLYAATKRLCESGVHLLGLAALDGQANPTYDRTIAEHMVRLGAEVGAMTPGELANWVAEKVRL